MFSNLSEMHQLRVSQDIKFYFVTKCGTIDDASKDLVKSYVKLAEFASSTKKFERISEAKCAALPLSSLTKRNVFVLDQFEGQVFEWLCSAEAIVLGPQFVLKCQFTKDIVPNIASPIFTLVMTDVVVCVSGFTFEKRSEIYKLVGFMGGLCTNDLTKSTHLITDSVKSPKYEFPAYLIIEFELLRTDTQAAIRNIQIMKEKWIFDVWKCCKTGSTTNISQEFHHKYKMPIFNKLAITAIGISKLEKNEVIKLIECNGGKYVTSLRSELTDLIISAPNQRNIFEEAVICKDCVTVDWVKDSVSKGYALSYLKYLIYPGNVVVNSTLMINQSIQSVNFNPNGTELSDITHDTATWANSTTIDIENTMQQPSSSHINSGIFGQLTFAIFGFSQMLSIDLKTAIDNAGGITVEADDFSQTVDYLVISEEGHNFNEYYNYKEIVTILWIQECLISNKLLEIKYYHRAIRKKDNKPLNGVSIAFSNYPSPEKDYLEFLAHSLGCDMDQTNPKRILICATPEGQEYDDAIKLAIKVVSSKWLVDCYELDKMVPLHHYAVGEAKYGEGEENSSEIYMTRNRFRSCNVRRKIEGSEAKNYIESEEIRDRSIDEIRKQEKLNKLSFTENSAIEKVSPQSLKSLPGQSQSASSPTTLDTTKSKFSKQLRLRTWKNIDYSDDTDNSRSPKQFRLATDDEYQYRYDIFGTLDRKFTEPPKEQPSTPCSVYRSKEYEKGLGDKFCGKSLRYEGDRRPNEENCGGVSTGVKLVYGKKPKISFSMSSTSELQEMMDKTLKLKGGICKVSTSFDPSCTHLICSQTKQSAIILSCIASGRWILCPAYIEDSFKAGHFLNEEEYEWGNPKAKLRLPLIEDAISNKIGMACHKWRRTLELRSKQKNRAVGIFSDLRAILHVESMFKIIRSIIEAGCGVVVDIEDWRQNGFRDVTHCFIENRIKTRMTNADKMALQKAGVHCVSILFMQAFFLNGSEPSVNDHIVN